MSGPRLSDSCIIIETITFHSTDPPATHSENEVMQTTAHDEHKHVGFWQTNSRDVYKQDSMSYLTMCKLLLGWT